MAWRGGLGPKAMLVRLLAMPWLRGKWDAAVGGIDKLMRDRCKLLRAAGLTRAKNDQSYCHLNFLDPDILSIQN